MKKGKLLNSELSYTIAKMGHTDTIAIADSGLPIPNGVNRIDLALTEGIPSFMDTLTIVLEELKIEEIIIAKEIEESNPKIYSEIIKTIDHMENTEASKIQRTKISHEKLKKEIGKCSAVVRTGEFTPYSNIILKSSVVF